MQTHILLAILILGEVLVFPRLSAALLSGVVPLNPLGWFGYGELAEVTIERRRYPLAYWLIVFSLTVLVMCLALFICAVAFRLAV
ncbi:MAG TPA: hypothetical protein VMI30_09015 [Stellaceae bacterium]|nr:hypothetical protein [Stellaceae bacterium]